MITDWDKYYSKAFPTTVVTRKISSYKVCGLLKKYNEISNPNITELGGANSSFATRIIDKLSPILYDIVDNCSSGLKLSERRFKNHNTINIYSENVLEPCSRGTKYDIVFSVGLIEHFDKNDTARCVKTHFDKCKKGGVVLLTFPHPTLPYNAIRKLAEITDRWIFHDERALNFKEVRETADKYGSEIHQSINWWIGLTQGYLVYRCF